ncbi:MAG TPA: dATP/dGTP diphosphohydrolase domain-containing protein [Pyrinomonadaceae bacterium]|nr:dATP/dGTP diphosphohydrolase domain-containing protein [Pyrinomonadaceae bacterium]
MRRAMIVLSHGFKPTPWFTYLMIETESIRPSDDLGKGGVKKDLGKLRWSLLPWDALEEVVKVLMFGASKYADRNWEKGMDWDRVFDGSGTP